MKLLKTSEELVCHMKNKGILFNIIDEESAKQFLQNNNYYMKLASYRTNYEKRKDGTYINLEFAYLIEVSKIDMRLRYIILEMCLDIEHAIKTKLLSDIENNPDEDGYDIIRRFVTKYERCLQGIQKHKSSEYCRELIEKYYPYFPVWVFVELISFGDLVKLYEFYQDMYPGRLKDGELLYSIRDLRNASAHSNCFLNDFVTLIYAYDIFITSDKMKTKRYMQLQDLLSVRAIKNKEYFDKNEITKSAYKFVKIIVDAMVASVIV